MFANLKRKLLVGSAAAVMLFAGGMPVAISHAYAQGPVTTPATAETIESPEIAGEVAEAKGADLDTVQAGPGQQLEQQGGSTLDGNF